MTKRTTLLLAMSALWLLCSHATAADKPVSAALVNKPPDMTDWEVGDVQVTYADGTTKVLTHGEKCGHPHVSGHGDIGWSVWKDINTDRYKHSGEKLRVLLRDGTTKDFQPNSRMIMDWHFVDDDSAVVIVSMGYHGPSFFIKYDLRSGRKLGQVDVYMPTAELPKWAQPFSDE